MSSIAGTCGYETVVDRFVEVSQALDFHQVCKDFVEFLPDEPGRVLDAGAGAGQNAAALARLGHSVIAVEPLTDFLDAGRLAYGDLNIQWINDALPSLETLGAQPDPFDFILVEGVWHHLDETEQQQAMARLAGLLEKGGTCAISLRNGPAGAGTHLFPTDGPKMAALAMTLGLKILLCRENQPSIMAHKPDVTWTRLVVGK